MFGGIQPTFGPGFTIGGHLSKKISTLWWGLGFCRSKEATWVDAQIVFPRPAGVATGITPAGDQQNQQQQQQQLTTLQATLAKGQVVNVQVPVGIAPGQSSEIQPLPQPDGAPPVASTPAPAAAAPAADVPNMDLHTRTVKELRAMAAEAGASDEAIEAARDGDDPQGDLIALLA